MKDGLFIDLFGRKFWHDENGKLHREDGPAYEGCKGTKEWWINGKYHREDGPAIEGVDGYKKWYLDGEFYGYEKPDNWDELVNKHRAIKLLNC
jgi:hypothetical protein